MFTQWPVPASAGVGLKPQHFQNILQGKPSVDWFEVHPENYMVEGGPMLHFLEQIRENFPLSFHSVGMSLGSGRGFQESHLHRLKTLSDRFKPALISDHLSWSHWDKFSLNDLLPMPYTFEALKIMCENVDRAQTILGRKIAIENPSSYFDLKSINQHKIELDECDFLIALAEKSGADILLDVNNVYVSAFNHGWNAEEYIKRIPAHLVSEIHLAGHSLKETQSGEVRIDDHGSKVCKDVWALYEFSLQCIGKKPTLIEWDTDVPDWKVLETEAQRASNILREF